MPGAPLDTIAAVASPPGRAPRGLVRLSGPATFDALGALVTPAPSRAGATRAHLSISGARLPILLLTYRAPRSYTGEDGAEIIAPGNPDLLTHIIDALCALPGVRAANPGEFTARAHLAGKLTIEQAEGVAALIAAEDESQRIAAERLLSGASGERYRAITDRLAESLALVEAGVDFTDQEDVVAIGPDDLMRRLEPIIETIDMLAGPESAGAPDQTPTVVLAGAPNTGKSSLFNALLGHPRAIVSETPGATRDALRETLELGARSATLVDLAGLDEALAAHSTIDAQAQQIAAQVISGANVMIVCDPFGRFELASLAPPGSVVLRVRTKADLPGPAATDRLTDALSVCALDGWNLGALRRAIGDACARARGDASSGVVPRHRAALVEARCNLRHAHESAAHAAGGDRLREEELIADHLRAALDELGSITGRIDPDDVLGRIFASFCIGK